MNPSPCPLFSNSPKQSKYKLDIEQTKKDIRTQGLAVILASNPRNPTGQVIEGNDLRELVSLSREGTTVILDEVSFSVQSRPLTAHEPYQ